MVGGSGASLGREVPACALDRPRSNGRAGAVQSPAPGPSWHGGMLAGGRGIGTLWLRAVHHPAADAASCSSSGRLSIGSPRHRTQAERERGDVLRYRDGCG